MSLAGVHASFAQAQADRRLKGSGPVLLSIVAFVFVLFLAGARRLRRRRQQRAMRAAERFDHAGHVVGLRQKPGEPEILAAVRRVPARRNARQPLLLLGLPKLETLPHCSWCS